MAGTTVRVSSRSAQVLKEIAKRKGETIQKVLDEAVEEHRRTLILKEVNSAYAELKNDSSLWDEEKKERDLWADTLNDDQEGSY